MGQVPGAAGRSESCGLGTAAPDLSQKQAFRFTGFTAAEASQRGRLGLERVPTEVSLQVRSTWMLQRGVGKAVGIWGNNKHAWLLGV